jgi:hypothetical protein
MFKIDETKVKLTMFEISRDRIGAFGSWRVQLLKKLFRLIIDNLLSPEMKTYLLT